MPLDILNIKKQMTNRKQAGSPPGTLVYTGKYTHETVIDVIVFSADAFIIKENIDAIASDMFGMNGSTTWVRVTGLSTFSKIEALGSYFKLPLLLQEDILSVSQRPKYEEYIEDNAALFVARSFIVNPLDQFINTEQIGFVLLGHSTIITFSESSNQIFDPIIKRLGQGRKQIRSSGTDYLLYAMLDTIIDYYNEVVESLRERIENLETRLMANNQINCLEEIIQFRKTQNSLRRGIQPLREALEKFEKGDLGIVKKATLPFLRDLNDHVVYAIENVEAEREIITNLHDLHFSGLSNKMNEVMKLLTIIATIFIPLTFIAGIYGMNFTNMPELLLDYGYFATLAIMLILALIMLVFFRKKRWL